jgi:hypothetical protein
MNSKYRSKMYDHIHFAVMAIEGGARRLHISGQKMHDRLKAQLVYKKVNHQICIRAQEVIDTYLRHVGSVELKGA